MSAGDGWSGVEVETDLDAEQPSPARDRPARPSRRRLGAVVALVVVALVVALVVADRTRRARASEVLLEAVGGELLTARGLGGGASRGGAVLATLEVELLNTGTTGVTLVAVRADGTGDGLIDGLGASGSESLGLERGHLLAPGATRSVELEGWVACPPDRGSVVEPAGLVVQARAADGTARTVEVAAPDDGAWRSALTSACALGPDDAFPNDQRPQFAGGLGAGEVVLAQAP